MAETRLQGIAASEGIAVGPAFCMGPEEPAIPERKSDTPEREAARFGAAVEAARAQLLGLRERLRARADEASAAIFDAHLLMLEDPMLRDGVQAGVRDGITAERAVVGAVEGLAQMLGGMADERFAARAADVRDVGRRLLRVLLGHPESGFEAMAQPSIIVAHDLTPSDTAGLDPGKALGFCTAVGGQTSHTSILARTLGIPAVVGLGKQAVESISSGQILGLDGGQGLVLVKPKPGSLRSLQAGRRRHEARRAELSQIASQKAHTADGVLVRVGANIGKLESARIAVQCGAEEVGLLRTEFLYLGSPKPPDEESQLAAYRDICTALEGRPIVVRTLDIGGDKPPSFLNFPKELNPFLGWRAIRVSLSLPDLFKTQLRAILRAAVGHRVSIMHPMVNDLAELRLAHALLEEARAELGREGVPYAEPEQVGVMVETPAAALLADQLALECDFVSLGTNDLIQYTLAVDRTNARVADLFQPLHPAVLRSIRGVVEAVHAQGKWVGMCGEMAGMKKAIPILLGLGLDEFSMVPSAIPEAKWLLSRLTRAQAHEIADQALRLATTAEVEQLMSRTLADLGG